MSLNIKLKRSAVAGSTPTAAQLEDGELAVNYNDTDPALYIKDSTGAVVRIAGGGAVGGDLQAVTDAGNTTTNDLLIGAWDGTAGSGVGAFVGSIGQVYARRTAGSNSSKILFGGWNGANQVVNIDATGRAQFASDVLIGGTLPASPAISLNGDGSAEFAGGGCNIASNGQVEVRRDGNLYQGRKLDGSYVFTVEGNGILKLGESTLITLNGNTGISSFAGDVLIGGTLPSSPNISLNANGSVTAGSSLSFNTTGARGNGQNALVGYGSGGSSSDAVFIVKGSGTTTLGGTPAAPNISLNADGSAAFGGGITANGSSTIYRATTTGGNAVLTIKSDVGGTNSLAAVIRANGSAEFTSSVTAGNGAAVLDTNGLSTSGNPNGGNADGIRAFSLGYFMASRSAGDPVFTAYTTGSSAATTVISSEGNIKALGPAAAGRVYADNTAAKTGGLVDGDFYRKADGTLMVVFT